jgi:hypothetical protein
MVRLENGTITYSGHANTHTVVSFFYIVPGSAQAVQSGPVQIAPGESVVLELPSGPYTFGVVYDDGHSERLQAPADQVNVYAGETVRVLFVY